MLSVVLVLASVALVLGEELLLHVGRNHLVRVELHRIGGAALGERAQRGDVLEHVGERHLRANNLHVAAVGKLSHHAAARVDVADNLSHRLLGRRHLDLHIRLHQLRARLAQALARGGAARDLESHHRRVNVVESAVEQRCLAADDGEAGEHAVRHHRLETLGDARDVLLGHGAALDLLRKLKARRALLAVERLELDLDLGELARATRLLLVRVLNLARARDRLAIGNLRRADVALDLELALHAVADDVEVKLAHPLDDGLAGVFVAREAEGRVLGCQLDQGVGHLLLVRLGLRLNGHLDHGLGEVHLFENNGAVRVAQRLSRRCVLATDDGDDVACARHVDVGPIVRVHFEHASNPLLLALDGVEDRAPLRNHARVHARKRERAHKGIRHDLEGKRRKGFVVGGLAHHVLLAVDRGALDGLNVRRRGHVVDDGIEERLHALVLEGGAGQHGHEVARQGPLANEALQLLRRRVLAVQIGHQRLLVELDGELDELGVVVLRLLLQLLRDLADLKRRAQVLAQPADRLHLHEIDHALKVALAPDRQLQHGGRRAEEVDDRLDAEVEVRARPVHLVEKAHARHVVLVCLTPHRLRLRLDPRHAVKDRDRAVEDAERALDLEGEVDVPRRVDDVDPVLAVVDDIAAALLGWVPVARRRRRRDGDASLLLLLHPVHRGAAVVDLANLVRLARVEEDALSRRGLARVDVRHDADVAVH
mmetsp:Transcript_31769/g.101609  ORF Transcript_31769/g.101609 Transcript_31769/m.101609 type:complete len:712 (+) Transcript_31769:192-2327(+)